MIVDELILKLQADLGDIKKSLKKVEADAAKSGKAAGTSFGDVFNAIAGAAVLNTVKGFFSKAAAEFNKMEAAMMRVDSIAKGFGRSVEVAKKQVNELADKGFLNLNQAASSYADAIALGFDEKQARKFIDSLSDIAAFQNTIGNGAEAVQSGLAGLLSNSAEKVENIGVPVKVLNQEYQKNIATMGKAAALQKFYNGILKESDKFQGDAARSVDTLAGAQNKYNAAVDKAMVAVGQGLEPVLKSLYETGRNVALAFAEWFGKLNEGTKSIILVGAALVAIIPAFSAISAALAALSINPIVLMVTAVVAAGVAIAAVTNQLNSATPKDIVRAYKDGAKELDALGEKVKNLEAINKRTISQEIELIQSKDKLRERAKALGDDYEILAAKATTYAQALEIVKNGERDKAAAKIDEQRLDAAMNMSANRDIIKRIEAETGESLSSLITRGVAGYKGMDLRDLASGQERYASRMKMADLARAELYSTDGGLTKKQESQFIASGATEQRFLEAQNKLKDIEKNLVFTISQAKKVKDPEERKRRIDAAKEDAEMQVEAEFTTRRQAYAEFIENKYMADTEALKKSTDDAIRASNEILEAELKNKKLNEAEILDLQADNEIRIQKIREANARKQAEIDAKSYADTLNAAGNIASAASSIGRSSGVGAAIGGGGQLFAGIAGLSDNLKGFGIIGQGISAVGTTLSALTGLFGKSDAERQREAQQQAQRDEEARKLLELQAGYQKGMLALQEAAAKLPFENLQRNLRLVDIQSQKQILSGADQSTVDASRLSQKQAILQGVLSDQSGEISKNDFFAGTQATPDALIQFLSERAAQSLAIQKFVQLMESFQSAFTDGVEDPGYWNAIYSQIESYRGKVPDKFFSYLDPLLRSRNEYVAGFSGTENRGNFIRGLSATFGSFASEITSDTSIAENLLSLIEQSQQIQLDIAGNTKKTAENTSKALELRPDRERSFIDVGLGFMQSLGQRITSPSGRSIAASLSQQNFSIPAEIGSASVTSSRARTLQERMADALEMQLMQGATANDILRDIRALTYDLLAVMDGDASTGASFSQQDFINFSSDVKRRRI
jgi:hypothetical protein